MLVFQTNRIISFPAGTVGGKMAFTAKPFARSWAAVSSAWLALWHGIRCMGERSVVDSPADFMAALHLATTA